VKIGVTLPQFGDDVEAAIAAARAAEAGGLDGVFVFDHLWAIGRPERPALTPFPLLGALASETTSVTLGTLVARVGLFADAVLVHHFATLHRMLGDRLVAGLGTGDSISAPENIAFGVGYPSIKERRAALARCCRLLRGLGITTWVGGASAGTLDVARRHADAVNLWDAPPSELRAVKGMEVTWGGIVGTEPPAIAALLGELRAAGATWAVCAAPHGPEPVVEACRSLEWLGAGNRPLTTPE
jgi:alkanesulfonate monooxygenase SsuD/methylene tetrahydromethanopterin reductase-like flavin-dependent oxidoreductase (luciferase family)